MMNLFNKSLCGLLAALCVSPALALDITATQIPDVAVATSTLTTSGYRSPGDGGDAFYVKSTPSGACAWQDLSGQWWALDISKPINILACGAWGDNDPAHDDGPAMQNAINAAQSFSTSFGGPGGEVICPAGKSFLSKYTITFDNPFTMHCKSFWNYTGTSGAAFLAGAQAPRTYAQWYDISFRGVICSGGGAMPNFGNGTMGVHIVNMAFSRVRVDMTMGCTWAAVRCDGTNSYRPNKQVIQHNLFDLGQIVNNGYGVFMDSIDAATSSCQADRWDVLNAYQNYINFQINGEASDSHTFNIQSSDNSTIGYIASVNGLFNTFNLNFMEGIFKFEPTSGWNVLNLNNKAPAAVVSNWGASTNKCYQVPAMAGAC